MKHKRNLRIPLQQLSPLVAVEQSHSTEGVADNLEVLAEGSPHFTLDHNNISHLTADSEGLDDYFGTEEINLGDGSKIPITHTGSKQVNASGNTFNLDSTYCAPLLCEGPRDSDAAGARTGEGWFI